MNTLQISRVLNAFNCLQRTRFEITAINALPNVVKETYPQIFIVNNEPFPEKGKHWLCIILFNTSKAEYFDSIGKPPEVYGSELRKFIDENSRVCNFRARRLQSRTSDICGLYVIFFVVMRICYDVPLGKLYSLFSENAIQNDEFVKSFFCDLNFLIK